MSKTLITGTAGFIGMHTALKLKQLSGVQILGIDNFNDYYDVDLKHARAAHLQQQTGIETQALDLTDLNALEDLFKNNTITQVIHLAAQPGVRYSIDHPQSYINSNIQGFINLLECCRHHPVEHLVYASSSSVYGANKKHPFSEHDNVDHPMSLYAATKKANELMAHTYSSLYGIPTTGLRFFTVYGPWGRPDMAPMIFARKILAGEPIQINNHGKMARDFTYVDDIVKGILAIAEQPPEANPQWNYLQADPATSYAPYRVYNIGRGQPTHLMDFITTLEKELGAEAIKEFRGMQPGDVYETWADTTLLAQDTGYAPSTSLEAGIQQFVAWYRDYYNA